MSPDRVCTIIAACAVLHNIALLLREPELADDPIDHQPHDMHELYHGPENGHAVRNHISNTFF